MLEASHFFIGKTCLSRDNLHALSRLSSLFFPSKDPPPPYSAMQTVYIVAVLACVCVVYGGYEPAPAPEYEASYVAPQSQPQYGARPSYVDAPATAPDTVAVTDPPPTGLRCTPTRTPIPSRLRTRPRTGLRCTPTRTPDLRIPRPRSGVGRTPGTATLRRSVLAVPHLLMCPVKDLSVPLYLNILSETTCSLFENPEVLLALRYT
ncbi:hypothetical protein BV898_09543 [Hypsibius exemplaris]|uniref:Uncharacterized protein n=1 Tax=Hypsibius exemplaris TaxID=2072580 RepID=A0A1W0WMF6_HYPEX|nr:hypothetical protein BV898_09543 [Hypsibius exemplaris]